jgi:hypothetical protein
MATEDDRGSVDEMCEIPIDKQNVNDLHFVRKSLVKLTVPSNESDYSFCPIDTMSKSDVADKCAAQNCERPAGSNETRRREVRQ